ncbi:hypothetical protein FHS68_001775 [Dyadobacter arcticus]|uniref:Uncharacterized protein n=1 Tax=Dyadobacter arcticus TaxID=1078754 RepID=A0ABX0ULU5_9BACT|nr:hypothetical protein [Dyadobacter arcticus]
MTYYIHHFLRQFLVKSVNSKIVTPKNPTDSLEEFMARVRINSRRLRQKRGIPL